MPFVFTWLYERMPFASLGYMNGSRLHSLGYMNGSRLHSLGYINGSRLYRLSYMNGSRLYRLSYMNGSQAVVTFAAVLETHVFGPKFQTALRRTGKIDWI